MLRNYIAVALRTFAKHRLYTLLNVLGLAAGMACTLTILTYVTGEASYDRWVPNSDRLYRLSVTFKPPGQDPVSVAPAAYPMAPAVQSGFPDQIEAFVRIGGQPSAVRYRDISFFETARYADPTLFEVIPLPLAAGDPKTVLAQPESAVISESLARKYFGIENPIGKTIVLDATFPVTVTGIMRDLPFNTHLDLELVIPMTSAAVRGVDFVAESWFSTNFYTYLLLAPGADPAAIEAGLPDLLDRNIDDVMGMAGVTGSQAIELSLDPFTSVHTAGARYGEMKPSADAVLLTSLGLVAVLVLLVACINFVNLTTAYASSRAREVALRKIAGATRTQLISQFVAEAVLMTGIALVFGLALAELAQPLVNQMVDRPMRLDYAHNPELLVLMALIAVLTGVLGGLYPAILVSRVRPADVLKSASPTVASGSGALRTALVVLQFAISIGLGIATAVIYAQTTYAKSLELGYDRENLIIVTGVGRDQVEPLYDRLRSELLAHPDILSGASSGEIPTGESQNNSAFRRDAGSEVQIVRTISVEPGYFDVYGIRMLAGRGFDESEPADRADKAADGHMNIRNLILSRLALPVFGFSSPEEAIGRTIQVSSGDKGEFRAATVVGVVEDVHLYDMREKREPTVYFWSPTWKNHLTLKVTGQNLQSVIEHVDTTWRSLVPDLPVRRRFLSESFDALYAADEQRGLMLATFTGLAIFIASLGLFGLASFTARRRTKEIGIRKVMGASTFAIVRLLVWQYSRPVLIANLIAWPIAYYAMQSWLDQFAYKIALDPLFFVGAGIGALAIAWLTVTSHAFAIAQSKPVSALRYE